MKYKIILNQDYMKLSTKVNLELDDGWELYGNLVVEPASGLAPCYYSQVVIYKKHD